MDTYEHTRDFTRDGCIVGARHVDYAYLEQWYVCADCGGSPVHHIARVNDVTVDWAECAECGHRDFISQRLYDRQCQEYYEIAEGLPPEMAALLPTPEPAVWKDEDLATFKSVLPDWLSSEKQHESAQESIV